MLCFADAQRDARSYLLLLWMQCLISSFDISLLPGGLKIVNKNCAILHVKIMTCIFSTHSMVFEYGTFTVS